jgi:hypothetical protein
MLRIILFAGCIGLSACATITRGTSEAFTVETHPSGAHVALSTGQVCDSTPCTFAHIKREAEFSVTIEKPGYKPSVHAITHQTAGGGAAGMAGNVLVGGIIGGLVDANSGATQNLVPNPLVVDLEPDTPVVAAAAPSLSSTDTASPAVTTPAPAPAQQ